MSQEYKNFIDGQWVRAIGGETFATTNPADTRDIVGRFPLSAHADIDAAVDAARRAFRPWSLTPAPRRAEIIFKAGQLLQEKKEFYAREMTREMGKVLKEARGDVQEAIDTAYYAAGEGRRLTGMTVPSELPDKFAMSIRTPVGVCGLITPWNFPMAIPSWKVYPALVAGNTAVLKSAPDTPLCALYFVMALVEAGLPPGVLNLVSGGGPECGQRLAEHPDVALVSFTGSSLTGKTIATLCAQEYKRCSLEMGGKNAIIVMEDADLDNAVDGAIWGGFGTTGQRCTAASRLIVHASVYSVFVDRLLERVKALKVGNGIHPQVDVGPLINGKQRDRVHQFVEIGQKEGATLLCGGHPITEGALAHGFFYAPTLFTGVTPKMTIAREEIFGPVVSVFMVESFEEAVEVCNSTSYGLSSALYTKDLRRAFQAMRDLQAGIVYTNSATIGAEVHLPFGGVKRTGNGHREGGSSVLDIFTEWKTLYVDYSGKLQKAQIDAFEGAKSEPEA